MMPLFDEEQILKAYTKEIENNKDRETAERMIKMGKLSLEDIAEYIPTISLEELKEIKSEFIQ